MMTRTNSELQNLMHNHIAMARRAKVKGDQYNANKWAWRAANLARELDARDIAAQGFTDCRERVA